MMDMAERISARPMVPRSLICTPQAIWFWPGITLNYARGGQIHAVSRAAILQAATMLHGPEANFSRIVPAVETATGLLNVGR